MIDASGMSYHSIDDIEWESLTFKELFENAIGYPILKWEPQIFCETCTFKMIDWYRFKDQCKDAQQCMVVMMPIKKEVSEDQTENVQSSNDVRCRSCMSDAAGVRYQSVDTIGWESLSLKAMFESAIGYQIMKWEPQKFCNECARQLIGWCQFKAMCKKAQESVVAMVPIKQEPDLVEDVKRDMTLETETTNIVARNPPPIFKKIKSESVLKSNRTKSTFTFDAFVRNYIEEPLASAEPLGMFKTNVTNGDYGPMLTCFKQILWSAIKGHIVREIRFTDSGDPYVHEGYPGYATVRDIRKFVELKIDDQTLSLRDARHHLKNWKLKTITLYIYPLSAHVITKEDCEKARNLLTETLPYETLITDCPFPGCPIVVIASQLENHKTICSFNPDHNGIIFCCLSIGCTASVASKPALDRHYETCPYKLLMDHRKTKQIKSEEDTTDIDEKAQLKRKLHKCLLPEVIFANCPFSDCHNPKPSKKLKK